MISNFNEWTELEVWLRNLLELIPEGPFPVMAAVPRKRQEWSDWYSQGVAPLWAVEGAVEQVVQALLQTPHTIPTVECGNTRYLLRERLRCALCCASLLSDLRSQQVEGIPLESIDPDAHSTQEKRRKWLLVRLWEVQGRTMWSAGLMTAAMATQAIAGWKREKE